MCYLATNVTTTTTLRNMAVTRIKLTKRQYKTLAARLKPHKAEREVRVLYKELLRAADRPGLRAEISRREAEALLDISSDMPPVAAVMEVAVAEVTAGEQRDAENLARMRAKMDEVRGAPPGRAA